jgi:hypothetical protein
VICAQRHIHMTPEDALRFRVRDKYIVRVRVEGERELIFGDVVVRVNPAYRLAMHIDTDEGNAATSAPACRVTSRRSRAGSEGRGLSRALAVEHLHFLSPLADPEGGHPRRGRDSGVRFLAFFFVVQQRRRSLAGGESPANVT